MAGLLGIPRVRGEVRIGQLFRNVSIVLDLLASGNVLKNLSTKPNTGHVQIRNVIKQHMQPNGPKGSDGGTNSRGESLFCVGPFHVRTRQLTS